MASSSGSPKSPVPDEIYNDKRLSLAFEDLNEFPSSLIPKYADVVNFLDLSHNKFRDVRFLSNFDNLETVILDHNLLESETIFPHLPGLRTLWVNHNRISDLSIFITKLSQACPKLVYLSLMGNPGCEAPLSNQSSHEQLNMYRYYVTSNFPELRYLDDRPIAPRERSQALNYFPNDHLTKVLGYLNAISTQVRSKIRPVQKSNSGIV